MISTLIEHLERSLDHLIEIQIMVEGDVEDWSDDRWEELLTGFETEFALATTEAQRLEMVRDHQ